MVTFTPTRRKKFHQNNDLLVDSFQMVTPVEDRSAWKIVGKREILFDKPGVSVYCDQQLHLFKLEHSSLPTTTTTTSDCGSVHDLSLNESSPRAKTLSKFCLFVVVRTNDFLAFSLSRTNSIHSTGRGTRPISLGERFPTCRNATTEWSREKRRNATETSDDLLPIGSASIGLSLQND